jgi:hypothetical protein
VIFIYYFHYHTAFAPLLYSHPPEIFAFHLCSSGVSRTLFSSFLALIFNLFVNPIAIEDIQWKYYIVYCCLNAGIFAFIYSVYPETKGCSLEEIATVFGDFDERRIDGDDALGKAVVQATHVEEKL